MIDPIHAGLEPCGVYHLTVPGGGAIRLVAVAFAPIPPAAAGRPGRATAVRYEWASGVRVSTATMSRVIAGRLGWTRNTSR